jgi:hypothetical protein
MQMFWVNKSDDGREIHRLIEEECRDCFDKDDCVMRVAENIAYWLIFGEEE